MITYARYPMQMRHPSERPATISAGSAHDQHHGAPAMYPPVIVNNEDQEEYYISRGYQPPDAARPADFVTQKAAPVPAGYRPQEYPRWENGVLVQDPHQPIDEKTWPMWVDAPDGRRIVKTPSEYLAVMGEPYRHKQPAVPAAGPQVDADELAEFRNWKAAQAAKKAKLASGDERSGLLAMAEQYAVPVDKRWSTERIRRAVAARIRDAEVEHDDADAAAQ